MLYLRSPDISHAQLVFLFIFHQDFKCNMSSSIQSSSQSAECVCGVRERVPDFTRLPEADDSVQPQPGGPQHQQIHGRVSKSVLQHTYDQS